MWLLAPTIVLVSGCGAGKGAAGDALLRVVVLVLLVDEGWSGMVGSVLLAKSCSFLGAFSEVYGIASAAGRGKAANRRRLSVGRAPDIGRRPAPSPLYIRLLKRLCFCGR